MPRLNMIFRRPLLGFICLLLPIWGIAQSLTNAPSEALSKRLDEIQQSSGVPGFAVVISKGDETRYARAFGLADRGSKAPYTLDTIQPIGSVSKTVIGLALMKAAEMELLSLDADINDYLPFNIKNPHRPNDRITIRHLATHTSGLIDDEAAYIASYALGVKPQTTLQQFLEDYFSASGKSYQASHFAKAEVGKRYAYSNIASSLAALIVERVAKMPFDAFTAKYIFAPLEMSSTHWFADDTYTKRYATLYEIHPQPLPLYAQLRNADNSLKPYVTSTYPDGSLRTSANDLTKYMKAMSRGYFGQDGLIRTASFNALFARQFNAGNIPTDMDRREPNRAIFWAYARNGTIRHTGSDPGVFAFVSLNPVTKISRVFLLNAQLEGDDNARAVKSFAAIIEALDKFENADKSP